MEQSTVPAYGLWLMVIVNSAIFIVFAFSFFKPRTARDWRSFGAFTAFIVALFVEMYGFPLTIYLLSGWLTSKYPGVNFLTHENGHLLHTILGFSGDPHFDPLHIASIVFIGLGFYLLASAWRVLYEAQRNGKLAVTGLYARIRHPQYLGFVAIMFGFTPPNDGATNDAPNVPNAAANAQPNPNVRPVFTPTNRADSTFELTARNANPAFDRFKIRFNTNNINNK